MNYDDVRNMKRSSIKPDYVECPKCGGNEYFFSQRLTGANLSTLPVCRQCDEILMLSELGMQKVDEWREEAERKRRREALLTWALIVGVVLFIVVIAVAASS